MPLTGQQRADLLAKAEKGGGEGLRAVLDMIIDLYLRTDPLVDDRPKIRKVLEKLGVATGLVGERNGKRNGGGQQVAGGGAPTLPQRGGVRVGGNGEPLDPGQAAIEAQMDAAAGPHPMDAGGGGGRVQQQMDDVPTVGADGSPLDAQQAEAERAMNEAAGPRP